MNFEDNNHGCPCNVGAPVLPQYRLPGKDYPDYECRATQDYCVREKCPIIFWLEVYSETVRMLEVAVGKVSERLQQMPELMGEGPRGDLPEHYSSTVDEINEEEPE